MGKIANTRYMPIIGKTCNKSLLAIFSKIYRVNPSKSIAAVDSHVPGVFIFELVEACNPGDSASYFLLICHPRT